MAKTLSALLDRVKTIWGRFSAPQRMVAIGLLVAFGVALGTTWYFSRDVYVDLNTGAANSKDLADVVSALQAAKIPVKEGSTDGVVQVPKSQLMTAKMTLAAKGLPKGGAGPGFELFDTQQLTETDVDKQVKAVRAIRGELQKAINNMEGVASSTVDYTYNQPSPFIRDQKQVSASVIVTLKGDKPMSQGVANAIIKTVAAEVQGLNPDHVYLADTTGRAYPYSDVQSGPDSDKLDAQRQQESQDEGKIRTALEPLFGPGSVVAKVSWEYDWTTSTTDETLLGAPQEANSTITRENTSTTNTPTPAVQNPGATVNYPAVNPTAGTSTSDKSTNQVTNTPSSKTDTHTQKPGGTLKGKTASVTINADSLPPATQVQIQQIAANAIGAKQADIAVMAMKFALPATGIGAPSTAAPTRIVSPLTLTIALGGIFVLLLLGFIISLFKRPGSQEPELQPLLAGLPTMPPPVGTTLDVALGLDQNQPLPGQTSVQPRVGLADLVASGEPGQPETPLADVMEGKNARQQLEIAIAQKPKRQLVIGNQDIPSEFLAILEDLATNASEACAEVLRSWLKGSTNQPNAKWTGVQKAAIFSINIGPDMSARMIQHLSDEEIEQLTVQIARAEKVSANERDDLFQEFIEVCTAERYIHSGGIDYARQLLSKALGDRRANDILQRLTSHLRKRPFDSVRRTDPSQLAGFLQNEHPQTIAVVLAHLPADQAALVVGDLPQERQADIIKRIATLDPTSPEMLREAERVLERKLSALMAQESSAAGGIGWVVDVLNRVDRTTERGIMGQLSADDPELANEISQRMFLFEDIVKLDDITLQRVLRDVDMNKDLPLALKAAKDEVWRKITTNVSRRTAESLKEAVDLLGPVRIRDVEEAQARIVSLIRKLDEMGEIQLTRGEAHDEFV